MSSIYYAGKKLLYPWVMAMNMNVGADCVRSGPLVTKVYTSENKQFDYASQD